MCETYALHRQTFYLAQDYFDRFLLLEKNMMIGALQLIVLTCLLIASKMEVGEELDVRLQKQSDFLSYNEGLIPSVLFLYRNRSL